MGWIQRLLELRGKVLATVVCVGVTAGVASAQTHEELTTGKLQSVERLLGEGSWALALTELESLPSQDSKKIHQPGEALVRRSAWYRAEALMGLRRNGEAVGLLRRLAGENPEEDSASVVKENPPHQDLPRAMALRILTIGQGRYWSHGQQGEVYPQQWLQRWAEPSVLEAEFLIRARRLSDLLDDSDSLGFDGSEHYELEALRVLQRLYGGASAERRKDREVLQSRAVVKAGNDQEVLAELSLLGAGFRRLEEAMGDADWRAMLGQITGEFPGTKSGGEAQLQVAQLLAAAGEYGESLKALEQLARLFGKTPSAESGEEMRNRLLQPELLVTEPEQFGTNQIVELVVQHRNLEGLKVRVERVDLVGEVRKSRRVDFDPARLNGKKVLDRFVEGVGTRDHHSTQTRVNLGSLSAGVYVAEVSGSGSGGPAARHRVVFLVSDLALVVRESQSASPLIWVTDREKGQPRAGVQVIIADGISSENSGLLRRQVRRAARLIETKTDRDGLVADQPLASVQQTYMVFAMDGDHVAVMGDHWRTPGPGVARRMLGGYNPGQKRAYLYGDRPAVRPGQRFHWRAIVREQRAGLWEVPQDKSLRWELIDPTGQVLSWSKGQGRLSELGTANGGFEVPKEMRLGMSWLVFFQGDTWLGELAVRVEEYRRPEYEVRVELGEGRPVVLGERVSGKIMARYYRGDAVAGAKVRWTVRRRGTWVALDRFDRDQNLGWFDQDDDQQDPNRRVDSQGDIIKTGEGQLDGEGMLTLEFEADAPTNWSYDPPQVGWRRWWMWWGEPAFEYQVEATVVDEAQRSIDGARSITVGKKPFGWSLRPERGLLEPGDRAELHLSAFQLDGRRLEMPGRLWISRVHWDESQQQDVITTVGELAVRSLADQREVIRYGIPSGASSLGRWRFEVVSQDGAGEPVRRQTEVVVTDRNQGSLGLRNQAVSLLVDRRQVLAGETMRLLIQADDGPGWVIYEVFAGEEVLERRLLALTGSKHYESLSVPESWVPNVQISVSRVLGGQLHHEAVEVLVPPVAQVLSVELETDKPSYEPGETARVRLIARDAKGRPVDGEFSLAAFDDSLQYIAPDRREDIRRFFFGSRRGGYPGPGQINPRLARVFTLPYPERLTEFFHRRHGEGHPGYPGQVGLAQNRLLMTRRSGAVADSFGDGSVIGFPAAVPMMAESAIAIDASAGAPPEPEEAGGSNVTGPIPNSRSDFRDVAAWLADLRTGKDGIAETEIRLPDSLTRWNLTAVGVDKRTRVGNVGSSTTVNKELLVRLEPPRFLVERDELVVAGIVQSSASTTESMELVLEAVGPVVLLGEAPEFLPEGAAGNLVTTRVLHRERRMVEPGQTLKVEVPVKAVAVGEAVLIWSARSIGGNGTPRGDALERRVPVVEYGSPQLLAWAGQMAATENQSQIFETSVTVQLPGEKNRRLTQVRVILQPTLLLALRDSLPYLVDYPYGCVEQTVSRFIPAVVVAGLGTKLGLPPDPSLADKLPKVVEAGLKRLGDMQRPDGGWGWWPGEDYNPYMTAFVAHSLTMAKDGEISIPSAMLERALEAIEASVARRLLNKQPDQNWWYGRNSDLHTLALEALVLSLNQRTVAAEAVERLWVRRGELRPHGLAMLARVLWRTQREEQARTVLRNLENFSVVREDLETMHWGDRDRGWYWWDDAVESTAMALLAYLEVDRDARQAQWAMRWLVTNRTGARWKSTKDTAMAVFALTRWALDKREGQTAAEYRLEVLDGRMPQAAPLARQTWKISPENAWDGETRFELPESVIPPHGEILIRLSQVGGRSGGYFGVTAEFLNRSEKIEAAGRELKVERSYYRVMTELLGAASQAGSGPGLAADEGPGVLANQAGGRPSGAPLDSDKDKTIAAREKLMPLQEGELLQPGDMVEVQLELEAGNDFEYLMIEDPRPASFEAVAVNSGYQWEGSVGAYRELRDQSMIYFISLLREGKSTLRYRVRAENSGVFRARSTQGISMYVPDLRGNSASSRIQVIQGDQP